MTVTVEFHSGVGDPVAFACRLLRKACRHGARVRVTAPAATLAALDVALWTFEEQAFVPHLRWPALPSMASRTPIWLCDGPVPPGAPRIVVNLGGDAPPDADTVDRVIEVVGDGAEDRVAGRVRWRFYEEAWGVKPVHHAAG